MLGGFFPHPIFPLMHTMGDIETSWELVGQSGGWLVGLWFSQEPTWLSLEIPNAENGFKKITEIIQRWIHHYTVDLTKSYSSTLDYKPSTVQLGYDRTVTSVGRVCFWANTKSLSHAAVQWYLIIVILLTLNILSSRDKFILICSV